MTGVPARLHSIPCCDQEVEDLAALRNFAHRSKFLDRHHPSLARHFACHIACRMVGAMVNIAEASLNQAISWGRTRLGGPRAPALQALTQSPTACRPGRPPAGSASSAPGDP